MARRLAAIVAADVAGYSRLMAEDEAGTLAAVRYMRDDLIRPSVTAYGGRIVKLLGDGILIEFASAVDAVLNAVDVQTKLAEQCLETGGMRAIALRVGINVGDVLFEDDDVYGDGVNVAARLQELAPPGGICFSQSVYLHVRNQVDLDFLPFGERALKNIPEPVQVWRWHPTRSIANDMASNRPEKPDDYPFRGQQILDPSVTALLLDLHMRSARLAVSDAFDQLLIARDSGREVDAAEIYRTLGEELNAARGLLSGVLVERVKGHEQYLADGARHQTLSDFFESLTDSNRTAYALKLIPAIEQVLKSQDTAVAKRRAFMDLIQKFMFDQYLPRAKSLIKFTFTIH
jgi:class 3 adenylate cyclase